MKRTIFALFSMFLSNAIASPGAHGPDGEHLDVERKHTSEQIGRQPDGSVVLPMRDQAFLGIRTQFAVTENVSQRVQVAGVVQPHPEGHGFVQSSSDGRYEASSDGVPATGAYVSAGQTLGYIRYQDTAFELASQNSELFSVRNDILQTKRDVERLQKLGELASQQTLEQLETKLKNLEEQAASLQKGLEEPEVLIAPISGVLINHMTRNGQWVEAGSNLFEVVAPNMRQISAVTSDIGILNQIKSGSLLEYKNVRLSYRGHSPKLASGMLELYFDYIGGEESPSKLIVDQAVTVLAPLANEIEGILLPARSLVKNSENLPIVWIKASAERFLPQIVRYQNIEADIIAITHGLGSDNRVVVNGTSLLNQIR